MVVWCRSFIWAGTTWLTEAVMDEQAESLSTSPLWGWGSVKLGEDTLGDGSRYPDSRSLTGLTVIKRAEEIAEGVS